MTTLAIRADEILQELAILGTEQARKIYRKHGAGEKIYGTSFADIEKLRQRIKLDHQLAQQLWESGMYEARVLASMVADPKQLDEALIDKWATGLNSHMEADYLAKLVIKSAFAQTKTEQWLTAKESWLARAGWILLALSAIEKTLPAIFFEPYLIIIERDIHHMENRLKEGMNNALIAIGSQGGTLEEKAIATAKRIGKVKVDHGDTSCKTPDAAVYIQKALQRNK